MNEKIESLKEFLLERQNELPLVLHDTNVIEKKYEISGKSIQILKYRTSVYPLDKYYKHIIRI
ncbi:hypothetical protein SAMN05444363_0633 [Flavobacterium terrae]|uniref:Uncharacterized protein n=1 Tax=Flavobacterium terrae TaxID=415425 RepID=A0A1M6B9W7_9FLAO|nr:hypothetical protein SAMN05444363_0633 [Flavobacterium terrae]